MRFDDLVNARHSTRRFLPDKPVPPELLGEAVELAMRAPSNSNIQPWRLFVATDARRDRLSQALLDAARRHPPQSTTGLPAGFAHLREQLGALVYGSMGIDRDDAEGRLVARMRNFEFFGAPVAAVVGMHRDFGAADALGVGMFVQTLLLALTDRDIDSCVQVSIAFYPEVVREQLDIPADVSVLCGISIGYGDPGFAANGLRTPRNPTGHNVVYLDR